MNESSIENDFTKKKSKTKSTDNTHFQNCTFGMFKFAIMLIYLTSLFNTTYGTPFTSVEFVIKNKLTGQFIHPRSDTLNYLTIADGYHSGTHFEFEPVDGIWGYIRHKTSISTKKWFPYGGKSRTKTNGNRLHLSTENTRYCLFAIDQVNNHIIHRDGFYVGSSYTTNPYPPNGAYIDLRSTAYTGSEWTLINPYNLTERVNPYGDAKISGEWKLILAVEKPTAKQTWQYKYRLGKSPIESSSSSFLFGWEVSASVGGYFTSFSTSASLTSQIEKASSETWIGETEETNSIEVEPGKTVVVWQKNFIGEQFGHKAVFQSNYFAYTDNIDNPPKDSIPRAVSTSARLDG